MSDFDFDNNEHRPRQHRRNQTPTLTGFTIFVAVFGALVAFMCFTTFLVVFLRLITH